MELLFQAVTTVDPPTCLCKLVDMYQRDVFLYDFQPMIDTTLCNACMHDLVVILKIATNADDANHCATAPKAGILNKAHHNQKSRPGGEMADEASTELEQASPAAEVGK